MERFDDRELCREAVQPSTKAPAHAGWRQWSQRKAKGMAVFDAAAVRRQFLRKGGQDGPVEYDCLPPQYGGWGYGLFLRFLLADFTAEIFCWLFLGNFKNKASTACRGTAMSLSAG